MVYRIDYHDPSQKVFYNSVVFCVVFHQCAGKSDYSVFLQNARLFDPASSFYGSQRQKRSSSEPVFFQIGNHSLGRFIVAGNNILYVSSKRRLDCRFIHFIHFDQIRYDAEKTVFFVFLLHYFSNAVSVSVVTLRNIFQRFQTRKNPVVLCRILFKQTVCIRKFLLPFPRFCQ